MLKRITIKRKKIRLTRSQRFKRRLAVTGGQIPTSRGMARHINREIAGLRSTDSGILTRKPRPSFDKRAAAHSALRSKKNTLQEQYRSQKARHKAEKKAKKGSRKGGKRGARPKREAKKKKKGQ